MFGRRYFLVLATYRNVICVLGFGNLYMLIPTSGRCTIVPSYLGQSGVLCQLQRGGLFPILLRRVFGDSRRYLPPYYISLFSFSFSLISISYLSTFSMLSTALFRKLR